MASDDVQVKLCIQEIVKSDLQIKALVQDIRECDGPTELLEDLNSDAREIIQAVKNRIDDLDNLAREQEKETDKIAILKTVENYRKQLSSTQQSLRKAVITSQMTIDRKEKEILLNGGTSDLKKRKKSSKEALAKTSGNITDNLLNISRMMSASVKQSEQTMGNLVSSSGQIAGTHEEFKNMSGHVQNSRKLLTKYNRREFTDKLLIFLALVFFFATVLYITKRRVFGVSVENTASGVNS
ncbi:vesicle transport protein SEC20-like [Lineus longissimus]|uniref:vesicle transport protein SEC20-like n=1 Tax=Lineus longissimus TaxID=88925 RepID=UPI002B4E3D62